VKKKEGKARECVGAPKGKESAFSGRRVIHANRGPKQGEGKKEREDAFCRRLKKKVDSWGNSKTISNDDWKKTKKNNSRTAPRAREGKGSTRGEGKNAAAKGEKLLRRSLLEGRVSRPVFLYPKGGETDSNRLKRQGRFESALRRRWAIAFASRQKRKGEKDPARSKEESPPLGKVLWRKARPVIVGGGGRKKGDLLAMGRS